MSGANNAWPPPHCATHSPHATAAAPSPPATAHLATATPTTLCRGWTEARRTIQQDPLLDVPPETPGVGALLRGRTRGNALVHAGWENSHPGVHLTPQVAIPHQPSTRPAQASRGQRPECVRHMVTACPRSRAAPPPAVPCVR